MFKTLIFVMSALACHESVSAASSASCGLKISETKVDTAIEDMYPVTFTSCEGSGDLNTYTVQMQDGTIKTFKKTLSKEHYWYGEDGGGSYCTFNFLFDSGNGAFQNGSMTDFSKGNVVQFKTINDQTFAVVKNSSEFGED